MKKFCKTTKNKVVSLVEHLLSIWNTFLFAKSAKNTSSVKIADLTFMDIS